MGGQEYFFKFSFILGIQKVGLDERTPNMVSELSLDSILPQFGRKNKQSILVYFDGFSAKIWVKYYPSSILRPYLESSHQDECLRRHYERNLKN